MRRALDTASFWIARITNIVVVLMAAVMMSALILQVFSRYVMGASLIWSEELALILFAWATMLAATSLIRDGAHVKLDLILTFLPPRARLAAARAITAVICVFCLVLAWSGWSYTTSTIGQVSAAMRLPIEVLHLAAPVCGILGAFHAFSRLLTPIDPVLAEVPG